MSKKSSIGALLAPFAILYGLNFLSAITRPPQDTVHSPTPDEIRLASYFKELKMRGSCYLDHDTGDVSVYVFDQHGQKPWAEYTAIKGPTDGIPTRVFNHVSGTYEPSLTLRVNKDTCILYKTISQDFETGVIDQRALDVYFLVPFFQSALRGGAKPNVSPRQYMQAAP